MRRRLFLPVLWTRVKSAHVPGMASYFLAYSHKTESIGCHAFGICEILHERAVHIRKIVCKDALEMAQLVVYIRIVVNLAVNGVFRWEWVTFQKAGVNHDRFVFVRVYRFEHSRIIQEVDWDAAQRKQLQDCQDVCRRNTAFSHCTHPPDKRTLP